MMGREPAKMVEGSAVGLSATGNDCMRGTQEGYACSGGRGMADFAGRICRWIADRDFGSGGADQRVPEHIRVAARPARTRRRTYRPTGIDTQRRA
jgi:hypothetical protein